MNVADLIPEPLKAMGPGGLEVWQWLGIAVVLLLSILIGRLLAGGVTWFGAKLAGRTTTSLDDELITKLRSPLRMLVAVGVARLGILPLVLHARAEQIAVQICQAWFALGLVWG